MNNSLSLFVKEMRKRFGLTQVDLAAKAGSGASLCARVGTRKANFANRQGKPGACPLRV